MRFPLPTWNELHRATDGHGCTRMGNEPDRGRNWLRLRGLEGLGSRIPGKAYERARLRELTLRGVSAKESELRFQSATGAVCGRILCRFAGLTRKLSWGGSAWTGLATEHLAQCINCLKASGLRVALLINFKGPRWNGSLSSWTRSGKYLSSYFADTTLASPSLAMTMGSRSRFILFLLDATAQKNAPIALQQSERRMQRMMDAIPFAALSV